LRILALTTSLPFPVTNGLAMRSASILDALYSLGHEIHLLALDQEAASLTRPLGYCKSVKVIPHRLPSVSDRTDYLRRLRGLPRSLPYGTQVCRSKQAEVAIRDLCQQKQIDAVLCETMRDHRFQCEPS
jgi:hypothetical protein